MKALFLLLLAANVAVGAWLLLGGPADTVREPARVKLQINPDRLHVLTESELARLRSQAEHKSAAAATAVAAPAPAPIVEVPSVSCVEIGIFASETAAKKLRTRLGAIGLADRTSASTASQGTRLRVTGIDAATEAQIHEILMGFPKLELTHCVEASGAH